MSIFSQTKVEERKLLKLIMLIKQQIFGSEQHEKVAAKIFKNLQKGER